MLFPTLTNWKHSLVRHNGRKVQATVAIFRFLLVKNFAMRTCSKVDNFLSSKTLFSSFVVRNNPSHLLIMSSILILGKPTSPLCCRLCPSSNGGH